MVVANAPSKAAALSSKQRKARKRAAKPKGRQGPGTAGSDPDRAAQPAPEQAQQDALSQPIAELSLHVGAEVLDQFWALVESRRDADPEVSHAARLLVRGRARIAQKLGEEAVECVIEIMAGTRAGLVGESADVLYHLLIAWADAGIRPEEVRLRSPETVTFSSNRREDQEVSMLSLHLLQNCMVYINTLMVQQVLARPKWKGRLTPCDLHALTPLFWGHVNPYSRFDLDMRTRPDLS